MTPVSHAHVVKILKKIPLFSGLDEAEYEAVVSVCRVRQLDSDELVFSEGDAGTELFVLLAGEVQISAAAAGPLHVLHPGEVLGEIAVVNRCRRTATATARGETALLAIGWDGLDALVGRAPRASYVIMRNIASTLADRLTRANKLLARA